MRSTRRPWGRVDGVVTAAAVVLTGMAVLKEMSRPRSERTWHGELFGWLPYDFRRPTMRRIRETFWAPSTPRLFMPRVFGVGWDPNLGRVVHLACAGTHGIGRP